MDESTKRNLTEKLKVLESELQEKDIELNSIKARLNVAYNYVDDLHDRQGLARKNLSRIQKEFHEKQVEIIDIHKEMKEVVDVFTGNWFHRWQK